MTGGIAIYFRGGAFSRIWSYWCFQLGWLLVVPKKLKSVYRDMWEWFFWVHCGFQRSKSHKGYHPWGNHWANSHCLFHWYTWFSNALSVPRGLLWGNMGYLIPWWSGNLEVQIPIYAPGMCPLLDGCGINIDNCIILVVYNVVVLMYMYSLIYFLYFIPLSMYVLCNHTSELSLFMTIALCVKFHRKKL